MQIVQSTIRFLLYIILGLLAVGSIILIFADPFAQRFLEKQVRDAGQGQYSLKLEDFHISILKGDILLKGVKIETDTSRDVPGPFIFTEAEGIVVEGLSWLSYLAGKEIILDKVSVTNGYLELGLFPEGQKPKEDDPFSLNQLDIYPTVKDQVSRVQVGQLLLKNFSGTIVQNQPNDTLLFTFQNLEGNVRNFLLDEDMLFTDSRTFYSEQFRLEGQRLEFFTKGSAKTGARVGSLLISSEEDKAGIYLQTVNFLQQAGLPSDTLLHFSFQDLDVQQLILNTLYRDSTAQVEKVFVNNLHFFSKTVCNGDSTVAKEPEENGLGRIKDFNLASYLPAFLKKVVVSEINLKQISGTNGSSFAVEDVNFKSENVQIDDAPAFVNNRFLHSADLELHAGEVKFPADETHSATFRQLKLTAANGIGELGMSDFSFLPYRKGLHNQWMELKIEAVKLDTIKTENIPSGELILGNLILVSPNLDLHIPVSLSSGKELKSSGELFSLNDFDMSHYLNDYLEQLSVDNIIVKDMSLNFFKRNKTGNLNITIPKASLDVQDVLLNSSQEVYSESRIFYARQFGFSANAFSVKEKGMENWQFSVAAGNILVRPDNASLSLNSLSFYNSSENKKDTLLSFNLSGFHLIGIDAGAFLGNQDAKIQRVAFSDISIIQKNESRAEINNYSSDAEGKKPGLISNLNLADKLPSFLNSLEVKELDIEKVSLHRDDPFFSIEEGSLQAKDIIIADNKAFDENRFFHASQVESLIKQLRYKAGKEKQEVAFGAFNLKMKDGLGSLSLHQLSSGSEDKLSGKEGIDAKIDSINLSGINTTNLSSGSLKIERFGISHPLVVHYSSSSEGDSSASSKPAGSEEPDLYSLLDGYLDSLHIGNVEVSKGDFRFSGLGGSYYGLHLPSVDLKIKDIKIAPETAFTEKRIFHSSGISGNLQNVQYLFPDKVYRVDLDKVSFNTAGKTIDLQGFLYTFSENYRKKLEEENTNEVYRVKNKSIRAEAINWKNLLLGRSFQADKITSEELEVYVYKDFNVPYTEEEKPMPAAIIHGLKFPLMVKEFDLNEMEVVYEEMKKSADTAGYVRISELNGKIHNLTNIDSVLQKSPSMEVVASGRLMGKGYFQSHINVPLLKPYQKVRVTGTMDTLDVTELNRIVRYNSRIAIKNGSFYKVSWDFEAGEEQANGKVELSYENLEIQLSKPNSPDTTGLLKDIGSFLINKLVVDSNIAEGKNTKPEEVSFEQKRDKERSFFHLYVQSLLAGFIEAVGVPFQ